MDSHAFVFLSIFFTEYVRFALCSLRRKAKTLWPVRDSNPRMPPIKSGALPDLANGSATQPCFRSTAKAIYPIWGKQQTLSVLIQQPHIGAESCRQRTDFPQGKAFLWAVGRTHDNLPPTRRLALQCLQKWRGSACFRIQPHSFHANAFGIWLKREDRP